MQTFCNEFADCEWLRETHLRAIKAPEFHSFILDGNEDCPQRITLYLQRDPSYTQSPIAVYVLDSETLTYRDERITD